MNRKRIEKIMNEIDDILQRNYDDDFCLGIYLFIRYGVFRFKNYINDDELEQINKVLKQYSSLFDENINDDVKMILDIDNWED